MGLISFILFLSLACSAYSAQQLVKFTISSYILPDKRLQMELDIVTPRTPSEYAPIVYMAGLAGFLPSYVQQNLIDSIAESGYVLLTVSKLQSPNPEKITNSLKSVIDWLNENLQVVLNNKVPGVVADIDNRLILLGHSIGGRVMTEYLNQTCGNTKLQILLDPVDSAGPFGSKKDYIITPGKFLPYATPVLVIASELDPVKKDLQAACAPNNISNTRFYDAMSGPKWFLNVSKYGHVDFYNNEYRDIVGATCATCHKDCNFADYRTTVKQAILSFIDAILYSNPIALNIIQEAKLRVPAAHSHNYMDYDVKRGGFCVRVKQESNLQVQ